MLSSDQIEELTAIRKKIHTNPEIAGKEKKTAALIKSELEKTGPDEIVDEIGGHGLVAIYRGENPDEGENLMIRAELDGLKINEENSFDYRSQTKNRMHACGHDGHMAIVLGVAKYLQDHRPRNGSVMLLFQPAEETGEGAGWMMDDPKFKELKIGRGFALHNLPGYEENHLFIKDETMACGSTGIEITFKGKSSHAAHPEEGINPAQAIAELLQSLEALSQEIQKGDEYRILTVTYIQMGEPAFGISPGQAEVGVTLRAETDELLEGLEQDVHQKIDEVYDRFEGEVSYQNREPFATTVNDKDGVDELVKAAKQADVPVDFLDEPMYWSEDFGEFRRKCPITLFGLGAGKDSFPLHSEKYDFNDSLIPGGISVFVNLIKRYTNE